MWRKLIAIGLPLIVLMGAIGGASILSKRGGKPKRKVQQDTAQPVRVFAAVEAPSHFQFVALGTTQPAQQVMLQPEVVGLVNSLNPAMELGQTVQAGETLLRINDVDYRASVSQAEAQLGQAQVRLREEESRGRVAAREWALLGTKETEINKELALRQPQLASAKLNLKAAQANLRMAKLSLERTVVKAPFNAVIQNQAVNLGQRVGPGQPIATLVGTDHWWVTVSITPEKLEEIERPGTTVNVQTSANEPMIAGRFLRVLPDVNGAGKLLRVLIEVTDPLRLKSEGRRLFLGDTVQVHFRIPTPKGLVQLPRMSLRPNGQVWVAEETNADERANNNEKTGELVQSTPEIFLKNPDHVLASGIKVGTLVITSNVVLPVAKTKIRWQIGRTSTSAAQQRTSPREEP